MYGYTTICISIHEFHLIGKKTKDMLTAEQKQTFAKDGYLIFEEIVPKTLAEKIRYEVEILSENEKELGIVSAGEDETWDIDNQLVRPQFQQIIQNLLNMPKVMESVQELIGSDIHLLLSAGIVIRAGRGRIYWHRDSDVTLEFIAREFKLTDGLKDIDSSLVLPALFENTLALSIFLQDTSDAVGPMRVIPGSHRWEHSPNQPYVNSLPGEVGLPVPTGAAIIYEPSIWHTADANTSAIDCWTFTLIYRNTHIQPVLDALKGKV